jgi:protein SCO1/2
MNKLVTFSLWGVLVLAMIGVLLGAFLLPKHRALADGAGTALPASEQVSRSGGSRELFPAAEFSLTDQEGRTVSTADLRGTPWIADFIFTRCGGTCPIMSHKLAELQKQTPGNVKLVSFTVDPEHDTPPVLKEYAGPLKADPARWHFLTGTARQMADAAYGMKISVLPAAENKTESILHSTKFLLVNPAGKVVGIYDSTNDADMKQLVADATRLTGGKAL